MLSLPDGMGYGWVIHKYHQEEKKVDEVLVRESLFDK
jgi:hypothetical protein